MEIEVMLSGWTQCIDWLQESEHRLKSALSEVDIVQQQLKRSDDPAMMLIRKKLEKQEIELQGKIQTIRTMHLAMEKTRTVYLENEASIEDELSIWIEPNPGIQIMPGFSDRKWFGKVQSEIRLKG